MYKINSKISSPQLQNGFYVYNKEIYISKDDVYDKMIETKDYTGKINFYYNDHIFSKLDWATEPDINLEKLYIDRAKQLREKYDYLILAFSGGSDSTEILKTFLENNIFLDEVQTVNHKKLFDSVSEGYKKRSKINWIYHSEYEMNALPLLKELAIRSPNTKVTVIDASDFLIDETVKMKFTIFGHDGSAASTRMIVTKDPKTIFRYQHKYNEQNLKKENLKMAYIEGIEKPSLKINNKKMYFHFGDQVCQSTRYINKNIAPNMYAIEPFFWSADAPLIPVKQSHIIKKVLESDEDFAEMFFGSKPTIDKPRLMDKYIYKYSKNIIQARKRVMNEFDNKELSLVEDVFNDFKGIRAAEEYNQTMIKKYSVLNSILPQGTFDAIRSRDYFIGNMDYKHGRGR